MLAFLQLFTPYLPFLGGAAALCVILGFLWKFLTPMLSALVGMSTGITAMRDDIKELSAKIGQKYPSREGLLGDVEEIKDKIETVGEKQDKDHDRLLSIQAGMGVARREADTEKESPRKKKE